MLRLQVHGAGEGGVFFGLRVLEGRDAAGKTRRRIGHRLVQPQRVEVVAEVVMGLDILARLGFRIRAAQMIEPVEEARDRSAACNVRHLVKIGGKDGQDCSEIRRGPVAIHVALCKTHISASDHLANNGVIAELHDRIRAGSSPLELDRAAVRQANGQGSHLQLEQHAQGQTHPARHTLEAVDNSRRISPHQRVGGEVGHWRLRRLRTRV